MYDRQSNHFYAMILAGGGGSRLWPMSRRSRPKQLLPLLGSDSLLRISVKRLLPLMPPENIYIVTGKDYIDHMRQDLPEIPWKNFVIEPSAKDSGPAAALGTSVIHHRDPEAVVAILTADHYIANEDRFRDVLRAAQNVAASHDTIVTLGIRPNYASTGYGYIQRGEPFGTVNGFEHYVSLGFKEKPDQATAHKFLQSGCYDWNSGMFIWTAERALHEFKSQQPSIHALMEHTKQLIDTPSFEQCLSECWERVPRLSLDYAVMEGAERMAVIPVDIGWRDVGSWDALFELAQVDGHGNGFKGLDEPDDHIIIDTKGSFVFSDKIVALIGMSDTIVVDSGDALLVCHKDRAQDVKAVVNQLRAQGKELYL